MVILLTYISNVIPLPSFPSENPLAFPYTGASSLHRTKGLPSLLMPEKAPSAPLVLPLTLPLGSLCSVPWMFEKIHICTGQDLAEPLRRQLYQVPVSKHLLAAAIVSGFGVCIWDGSPGRAVSGWPFLWSLLYSFFLVFLLDRSNSGLKFWRRVGCPIPQPGGHA